MTDIIVNNNRYQFERKNDKTRFNDLLDSILSETKFQDQVISRITVNGKTLNDAEEAEVGSSDLYEFKSVHITLQSSLELAFEALDSCNVYVENLNEQILALVALYQEGKMNAANEKFGELVDFIDLFIQLVTRIHRTLKAQLGSEYQKSKTIQNLEIHLLSVLKAILPAKEREDVIMLCDLLEYELMDNLTQWKIRAIPELKNLKNQHTEQRSE